MKERFESSLQKHPLLSRSTSLLEGLTVELDIPPTPILKTMLIEPPSKCLHAHFKMAPIAPNTARQLTNLPGRHTVDTSHPAP